MTGVGSGTSGSPMDRRPVTCAKHMATGGVVVRAQVLRTSHEQGLRALGEDYLGRRRARHAR